MRCVIERVYYYEINILAKVGNCEYFVMKRSAICRLHAQCRYQQCNK